MFNYLKDIGVDFLSDTKPIMLGYDYGCLNGIDNCEKIYHSFNRKDSEDITKQLIDLLDKENILNLDSKI